MIFIVVLALAIGFSDLDLATARRRDIRPMPIGSSFEDFLDEEGIKIEAYVKANKRVFAWQGQTATPLPSAARLGFVAFLETSTFLGANFDICLGNSTGRKFECA